jgi:hypothetical protein
MTERFLTTDEIATALSQVEFDDGAMTEAEARVIANAAKAGVFLRTHIEPDESRIAIGATKLGGRPDLPPCMRWPMRPAYPDGARRAEAHREDAEAPDKR